MLNWENFVIQQEKMEKLRFEIRQLHTQSGSKLTHFEERISNLRATLRFFQHTCELVSSAFLQTDALKHGSASFGPPMSPGSKGDGTTVATERD